MSITVFFEEEQNSYLNEYNKDKKRFERIPLITRNYETGWPLLQVSLFTPTVSEIPMYEHALGGGKCHYFYIGAFNFACLLAKIPGKMEILGSYGHKAEPEHLKVDNVGMFLDGFVFHHKAIGIKISSESGAYGKTLTVECPEGDSSKLREALDDSFSFALKKGAQMSAVGGWRDSPALSASAIKDSLDDDVAVFSNGQIFVDLGQLIDRVVKDPEIKEYLATVFRVNEFLDLKNKNSEFKPSAPLVERDVTVPENIQKESEDVHKIEVNPMLVSLYFKIKIMRDYGDTLSKKDKKKGESVIKLADKLKEKVDCFNETVSQRKPDNNEVTLFQSEFKRLLHSQDEQMKEHREIWKPIVANILISLTIFGLLAIGVRAGINVINALRKNEEVELSDVLFFAKTKSVRKADAIEKEVDSIDFNKKIK